MDNNRIILEWTMKGSSKFGGNKELRSYLVYTKFKNLLRYSEYLNEDGTITHITKRIKLGVYKNRIWDFIKNTMISTSDAYFDSSYAEINFHIKNKNLYK